MNRIMQVLLFVGIALFIVSPANAQDSLVGDFRVQSALVLSDALLLDQDTTNKVVDKYTEISGKLWQEAQDSGQDFQSMSDEERRESFRTFRDKTITALQEDLKGILNEDQMKEIEPVMKVRIFSPAPEVRALRLIDIKDEQKAQLQPLALSVTKKMVPSNFGFFGSQMSDEEREKAQSAFDDALAGYINKLKNVLNEAQQTAWQEKVDAINKELEEIRARWQNQ